MSSLRASNERPPAGVLFGDGSESSARSTLRPRQQVVWCGHCNQLDSVFLGMGVSARSARCVHCGGKVVTDRHRAAKLKWYETMMERNRDLVIAAAHGTGDIDQAAEYAAYAARLAVALRLVPDGPEPER